DQRRILPTCCLLEGEYGLPSGCWMGVPAMLGANGLEKIFELKLNEQEQAALKASADHVMTTIGDAKKLLGM
ncbi:MAG: malate dehydrogenase, partial [Gemmatimonadota bacterium]|nr:malate dehydrogenase [Gemmatimonadota bacterium]